MNKTNKQNINISFLLMPILSIQMCNIIFTNDANHNLLYFWCVGVLIASMITYFYEIYKCKFEQKSDEVLVLINDVTLIVFGLIYLDEFKQYKMLYVTFINIIVSFIIILIKKRGILNG